MNLFRLVFYFSTITTLSFGQDWAWIKGPSSPDGAGVYGTQGVFAPANTPGARGDCAYWKDASGNIWLFGGSGCGNTSTKGRLSDIWKYDPVLNQWAWIKGPTTINQFANYGTKGVSAPTNIPGSRYGMVSWVDASGKFWMFGGWGYLTSGSPGYLNDLWKYDPVTNEWTWISGTNALSQTGIYGTIGVSSPTNAPGCRASAVMWNDNSGNFWMFGGWGLGNSIGYGQLNDLWKYNVAAGEWTWMKGSPTIAAPGMYGVKGIGSSTTTPGCRESATAWYDASGNFWLFGGNGAAASVGGYLNDLWKYNIASNQWTWVNGPNNSTNQQGSYALQGMDLPTNIPGGRLGGVPVVDLSGNLWMMSGNGYATTSAAGFLNDLWRYNISTDQWTWFKGASVTNQNGIYGTLGVSAPPNSPGSRLLSYMWLNSSGSFGLFGAGGGYGLSAYGALNDIWNYTICPSSPSSPTSSNSISSLNICSGSATSLTALGSGIINWFSSPTSTIILGSGNNFITPTLTSNTTFYIDNVTCAYSNTRTAVTITVNPLPIVTANSTASVICIGQTAILNGGGASTYTWTGGVSDGLAFSPTITNTYSVTGTDANGCINTAAISVTVSACTGVQQFGVQGSEFVVYPNPNNGDFTISATGFDKTPTVEIYNTLGKLVYKDELTSEKNTFNTNLAAGIYFINLIENNKVIATQKLICK